MFKYLRISGFYPHTETPLSDRTVETVEAMIDEVCRLFYKTNTDKITILIVRT